MKAKHIIIILGSGLLGSFYVLINDSSWWSILLASVFVVWIGLWIVIKVGTDDYSKDKKQQAEIKKIFSIITTSFCEGMDMNETKLRRVYEVNNLDESFDSFADFLEKYLDTLLKEKDNKIHYGKTTETPDNKTSYDDIDKTLSLIIKTEREEKPFEGVEERSRKLLQDIDKASKEKDFEKVNSGLKSLAIIMIENQKIYSKENLKNIRFARISGIATILSLVFAIIVFFIDYYQSLTSEDVKKDMIEVIDSSVVKDSINHVNYPLEFNKDSQTFSGQ